MSRCAIFKYFAISVNLLAEFRWRFPSFRLKKDGDFKYDKFQRMNYFDT